MVAGPFSRRSNVAAGYASQEGFEGNLRIPGLVFLKKPETVCLWNGKLLLGATFCLGLLCCDRPSAARTIRETTTPPEHVEAARTKSLRAEALESQEQAEAAADRSIQLAKSVEGMEPAGKRAYLEGLIYQHATGDRELACVAYGMLGAECEIPVQVTGFLAAALSDNDPEEALYWIEELPQGAHRRAAYAQLCSKLKDQSPQHAADLATKTIPLDGESTALFVEISGAWAKTAPLPAAEWTGRFPPGSARNAALVAVIGIWDRTEAGKWIHSISDSSLRKDAQAILDSTIFDNDLQVPTTGDSQTPPVE